MAHAVAAAASLAAAHGSPDAAPKWSSEPRPYPGALEITNPRTDEVSKPFSYPGALWAADPHTYGTSQLSPYRAPLQVANAGTHVVAHLVADIRADATAISYPDGARRLWSRP